MKSSSSSSSVLAQVLTKVLFCSCMLSCLREILELCFFISGEALEFSSEPSSISNSSSELSSRLQTRKELFCWSASACRSQHATHVSISLTRSFSSCSSQKQHEELQSERLDDSQSLAFLCSSSMALVSSMVDDLPCTGSSKPICYLRISKMFSVFRLALFKDSSLDS